MTLNTSLTGLELRLDQIIGSGSSKDMLETKSESYDYYESIESTEDKQNYCYHTAYSQYFNDYHLIRNNSQFFEFLSKHANSSNCKEFLSQLINSFKNMSLHKSKVAQKNSNYHPKSFWHSNSIWIAHILNLNGHKHIKNRISIETCTNKKLTCNLKYTIATLHMQERAKENYELTHMENFTHS